jgi:serine/threonine protein kinase
MEAGWYVRRKGTDTVGPVPADQVSKEIGSGNILSDAFVCPVGGASWCPVTSVAEFAAVFADLEGRSGPSGADSQAGGLTGEVLVGTQLGSYRIVRCIGSGGMGEVYEAFHTRLQKKVALKTLRQSLAQKPEARARFLREGETASRVRHPHIVDITDIGEDAGVPFLVMELLEGETLSAIVHRTGALSVEAAVELLLPVLDAVATAHEHDIIHRDLKPENIFLARSHRGGVTPKVLDFGISKMLTSEQGPNLTATTSFLGTPFYMSPEQAKGAKHSDARSDQYSLGVVLYETLTARQPHLNSGESFIQLVHAIAEGNFPPPRTIRGDLPSQIEAIILKAMHILPAERYASIREFGAALLPFAGERAHSIWGSAFGAPAASLPVSGEISRSPEPSYAAAIPTTLERGAATLTAGPPTANDRKSRAGVAVAAGLLVSIGIGAVVVWQLGRGGANPEPASSSVSGARAGAAPPESHGRYRIRVNVEPSHARLELDGRAVGQGSIESDLPRDGSEHTLIVTADGFISKTVMFRDAPPPAIVKLDPVVAPASKGATASRPRKPGGGSGKKGPEAEPAGKPAAQPAGPRTDNIDPWER